MQQAILGTIGLVVGLLLAATCAPLSRAIGEKRCLSEHRRAVFRNYLLAIGLLLAIGGVLDFLGLSGIAMAVRFLVIVLGALAIAATR